MIIEIKSKQFDSFKVLWIFQGTPQTIPIFDMTVVATYSRIKNII